MMMNVSEDFDDENLLEFLDHVSSDVEEKKQPVVLMVDSLAEEEPQPQQGKGNGAWRTDFF